ncbi:type II secretion system protein GspG [Planctomycetota bacterium]|nr:type II secretion system protein GspG [Planctomycetota bacterium]
MASLERILSRVLPHRGDRTAAKVLVFLAVGPVLLSLVLWGFHGATAAQLTWSLRAGSWPYKTEGQPLRTQPGGDQLSSWYRTSLTEMPVDPWGEAYYVEGPNDDDTLVCSAGPNGVFEFGEGDDIRVAGFFFFGSAHLLILLVVGGVLSSLAGAVLYFAWRQALMPRSPRVEVELARAAVVSLPLVLGCLCLVFATDLDNVAAQLSFAYVSPRVAVACTATFVVYMIVFYMRIGRVRAGQ